MLENLHDAVIATDEQRSSKVVVDSRVARWGRQIEGGAFGHLVGGGIDHAADQHTTMAHRMLRWQLVACILTCGCAIRMHVLAIPRPEVDLTHMRASL